MPTLPPPRPVVAGRHVLLRPLEPDDVELVHRWYEDAEFLALMGDRPVSLAARRAFSRPKRSLRIDPMEPLADLTVRAGGRDSPAEPAS